MSNSTSGESSDYASICQEAATDDLKFAKFKNELSYRQIVQTVGPHDGLRYYEALSFNMKHHVEKFAINDIIGNPEKFNYPFGSFSPTTLRYVKVLDDLTSYGLEDAKIAEIGAGFGGQYAVMRQLYKPSSYDFFDLETVLPLIKRYTKALHVDDIALNFKHDLSNEPNDNTYDLVISNYAVSECDKEIQDTYFDKVISRSKRGYITFNHQRGYSAEEFINMLKVFGKSVKVIDEAPQTGSNNIVITW